MTADTEPHKSNARVGWEMLVRWPWDDELGITMRVLSLTEIEITATTKNTCGAASGSRTIPIADLRRALDELERSARELENV